MLRPNYTTGMGDATADDRWNSIAMAVLIVISLVEVSLIAMPYFRRHAC